MDIPTLHIDASKKNMIAETVILTGDPLRTKWICNQFLKDTIKINETRGMLGYTGFYNNKKVTVMSSGMGMASIAIYSYELYKFYDVKRIIRLGTCGAFGNKVKVSSILLPKEVFTTSNFGLTTFEMSEDTLETSSKLYEELYKSAIDLGVVPLNDKIASIDAFYKKDDDKVTNFLLKNNCIAGEMEAFALYANAKFLNKEAACILTVPINIVSNEIATNDENIESVKKAFQIILNII